MTIKGLRLKMLEEAYQMIVDDGIESFTVRKLSNRLNISHNTMYRHFKSKSELIYTLLEEGFEHLGRAIQAIVQRDDLKNIEKYKECVFVSLEFAVNNSHIYKLMFATEFKHEDIPENFKKAYAKYYYQLLDLVEGCIKTGEIKTGTKCSILNTTWTLLHGLAMLLLDNILPVNKDLDDIPRLLGNNKNQANQFVGYSNIREVVGFSIDALFDSFTSKKKKSR